MMVYDIHAACLSRDNMDLKAHLVVANIFLSGR